MASDLYNTQVHHLKWNCSKNHEHGANLLRNKISHFLNFQMVLNIGRGAGVECERGNIENF